MQRKRSSERMQQRLSVNKLLVYEKEVSQSANVLPQKFAI
jgi:hypothetical protein